MAKCVNIVSMRDGRFERRFNSNTNTVIFPIDDSTIKTLHTEMKREANTNNIKMHKSF